MNTTKTPNNTHTKQSAKSQTLTACDVLIDNHCSFNLRHDPIKKKFTITTVNSADGMKVLIPDSEIKADLHGQRFAELAVEYV